ncbi:MAG: hypothetical protein ACUVWX_14005 [Kiritimatiellia bacterium]
MDTVLGENVTTYDVAILSDRRIAITYKDSANAYKIGVFTPQFDGSGNLIGLTIDAVMASLQNGTMIRPLPNGNFVVFVGTYDVRYVKTGPNSWSGTVRDVGDPNRMLDNSAGLVNEAEDQWVVCGYDRKMEKYNIAANIREYYNQQSNTDQTYTNQYDGTINYCRFYTSPAEGCRNPLLQNGWVACGGNDWGRNYETTVNDAPHGPGASTNSVVGFIRNSDGSRIMDKEPACLSDGRVVLEWLGGWQQTGVTWRMFTLVSNPQKQEPSLGLVGATGHDFEVKISPNFVGVVAGDYMWQPPPPKGTTVIIK